MKARQGALLRLVSSYGASRRFGAFRFRPTALVRCQTNHFARSLFGHSGERCAATLSRPVSLGIDGRYEGEFKPAPSPHFVEARLKVWDQLWSKALDDLRTRARAPIKITLPDGSVIEGQSWSTTPLDVAESISKKLAGDVVVALVEYSAASGAASSLCVAADGEDDAADTKGGQLWDLTRPLEDDCRLKLLNFDDPLGRETFWHSSSHILGAALEREYGGLLTIGPSVAGGFYYDIFLGQQTLSEADFGCIEASTERLRQEDLPFQRLVVSREEALHLFAENPFKVDLIQRKLAPDSVTTVYRCGSLVDLCRGPHLPSTGRVRALAITKNSSAYWRGSATYDSLQRVYGIAFPSAKQLKAHQKLLQEARERDHRRIGRQQELFFFDTSSPGSCFWTSHGTRIYNRLCELLRAEYRARGFEEVITPNIYSSELFKKSGHYANYLDDMYGFKVEGQEWFLKPMNCPGHCLIFDSKPRSYRNLPLRLASFGVLHRNELSGTLAGLTRVRRFQQDDAHIFCREDQIADEVTSSLRFVFDMYELFGFEFSLALSTRPSKALGSKELWERAEEQLRLALDGTGRTWTLNEGDGAFYGPKIDIRLKDALGRQQQCGTIQLDFQLPLRFDLKYQTEGPAGSEGACKPDSSLPAGHARPVMLHRAVLGSVERMVGVLCEHYAGKWPFWLSPRQCMVVPVSDDAFEYAQYVRDALHMRGFYVEANLGDGTLNKKIREAQLAQWNYILIVGQDEENRLSVNVRERGKKQSQGEETLLDLIERLDRENHPGALAQPRSLPPFRRQRMREVDT